MHASYMHTYIHTYEHTYINACNIQTTFLHADTCLHAYLNTLNIPNLRTLTHTHTYVRTCMGFIFVSVLKTSNATLQ